MYCARCVASDVLYPMLHRCIVPDVTPMCCTRCCIRCIVPDVTPMCCTRCCIRCVVLDVLRPVYARVCRGALPLFRHIAPTGRECNKTQSWGGPRVSFTPFTIPWAEIPLPLQGAASSKPSKHCIKLAVKGGDTVAKHGSFEYAGPIHYSEVLKPRCPIQEPQRPVIIRRF